MAAGLGIATLVRSQIIPRYEAESQLVLDVRNTPLLKFDAVVSGLLPQPEVVRTEMDVMASRGMAERVLGHLSAEEVKQLGDDGGKTTISLQLSRISDNPKDESEAAAENYKPDKVTPPTD